ncbi:phospholipase D1 [Tieghemostelium lacteum]|uniref:phospholipase D n=1 Tax=Tieghemostelium lacteum TaxID=361077 RepID=A0A151ZHI0_TIELA|nr:phospholipase D1 [Tieghemostelium lacteum]|eukprot:KYQ93432.1 phospholipase D1 [Tieghemostelium lacteum]
MNQESGNSNANTQNTNQEAPEILQQLTEGLHNFIDSISIAFSPTQESTPLKSTTPQKSMSKQNSLGNLLSSQSSLLNISSLGSSSNSNKRLSTGDVSNITTTTTTTTSTSISNNNNQNIAMEIKKSISPPRGDTIEPKSIYPKELLDDLEQNRVSLIEQLNSVTYNLDQQKDDDPITYFKNRFELTKIKANLESELKELDEILQTESKYEEPQITTMDSITSLFTFSTPTTTASSTAAIVTPPIGIGNVTANLSSSSLGTVGNGGGSSTSAHHVYPGLIVPTETPLNNLDPNQPRFPLRDNIKVKLYVDCDEYFAASAQAIENASREVFLTAWFLSPEVYLVRYPTLDPRYRLDTLLKRKAMQGVKIFIILWDETKIATFKGSKRAKDKLEELHHNIKVIKHPPIIPIYWSHHQKTLIIDQEIAFVGGVDFCFGRYDTWSHHLIDVKSQLWTGKDYYNPVLGDMGDILSPFEDSIDRMKIPRMPWHDVMVGVNAMAARDVALNFILRWNHHKDDYYPLLYYNTTPLSSNGTTSCQLLRSMDEWSGGGRNERSIHTAYIQAIEDADHYIYIENQNFVSTHAPGVWNQISFEIVKRLKRAIRKKEVFRIFIVLPSQQDGRFQEETHIRGLMHWQYATICKGNEQSILSTLKREFPETDLTEYIGFYSLRTHACLEGNYVSEQIYVHSKFMIIDDRVIIVGSANINDRSLNGERDSEIAFIIKNDTDLIDTKMNGNPYKASRTAFNFRLRLMKEHLGLLPFIEHPELPPLTVSNTDNKDTNVDINVNNINSQNTSEDEVDQQQQRSLNTSNNSNEIDLQKLNPVHMPTSKSHHRSSSFQGINSIIPGKLSKQTSPVDTPSHSPRKKEPSRTSSVIIEDYENTSNMSKSPPSNFSLLTISHNTLLNKSNNNSNNNNTTSSNNDIVVDSNNDNNNNNNNSKDTELNLKDSSNGIKVISEAGSPKVVPRSVSSLHDYTNESYCKSSGVDLTDPVCSDFYFGVWVATAASNTRIYDMVFPAIPKNSIRTSEQFNQQAKIPVSSSDSRLLSEVRGNLIYHPLEFLADEDLQPTFLFTDDLFQ